MSDYAERLDALPPLEVFHDGRHYWLWDGFHRYHAARKAGREEFPCNVAPGTVDEARWKSLAANKTHGLRRSNADKRRAVELALKRRPDLSDRAIAEHVGVSDKTVGAARPSTAEIPQSGAARVGKDGRKIHTANIGKGGRLRPVDYPSSQSRAEVPAPVIPPGGYVAITDPEDDEPEQVPAAPEVAGPLVVADAEVNPDAPVIRIAGVEFADQKPLNLGKHAWNAASKADAPATATPGGADLDAAKAAFLRLRPEARAAFLTWAKGGPP